MSSNIVAAIGEVMIELARGPDGRFSLNFGGDTFNTSVYLARAGIKVSYATAMGDDPYSASLIDLATAEGIGTDLITRVPGRMPGLHLIETDAAGERKFYYWRDTSPARDLFELPNWSATADAILNARVIYFSGITLSLYSNAGLGRFLALLELARQRGAIVAFDSNYRPRGWKGDAARARTVYGEALKRVDIALPSFDDEAALWSDSSPDGTVQRLQAFGVSEVVVKNGTSDALVVSKDVSQRVPVPQVTQAVDTTAAGDSFCAGYLAARLKGEEPAAAVSAAHKIAGEVVQHRGAIIPRTQDAVH
ncbi:2-dehydro-3-deoxygluconokinase [Variibacter gotjawalensis]|uniref:2-dehydro-3-deoxygluconokinase n=1 Tax=Variibacter gotjawalensis TaxID=1333996 RepID=A0A0S3PPC6_9BRAD|nr:sugar kinase [Variibacter gotjawalensis]NIK48056.1 2-dehydro-3-deoxygluconokinase [Variibacter gotjawalensis]RZS49932.1 2-dehydro-3-deoxygluconokinase [Variibacter gotjawalensis]BAT57759.1 2-dehydro-3-deoxygluconokinase [Variibacter gotjawalensis]